MSYEIIRKLEKLQEEGFIRRDGNTLVIHGDIWFSSESVPVYGGGIVIRHFDISFARGGRKVTYRLPLVEILEWLQFGNGEATITIELDPREEEQHG